MPFLISVAFQSIHSETIKFESLWIKKLNLFSAKYLGLK